LDDVALSLTPARRVGVLYRPVLPHRRALSPRVRLSAAALSPIVDDVPSPVGLLLYDNPVMIGTPDLTALLSAEANPSSAAAGAAASASAAAGAASGATAGEEPQSRPARSMDAAWEAEFNEAVSIASTSGATTLRKPATATSEWLRQLRPGMRIDARDNKGTWLEARIVEMMTVDGAARVHFLSWDRRWDEVVPLVAGAVAPLHSRTVDWRLVLQEGMAVEVLVGSEWFAATVLRVVQRPGHAALTAGVGGLLAAGSRSLYIDTALARYRDDVVVEYRNGSGVDVVTLPLPSERLAPRGMHRRMGQEVTLDRTAQRAGIAAAGELGRRYCTCARCCCCCRPVAWLRGCCVALSHCSSALFLFCIAIVVVCAPVLACMCCWLPSACAVPTPHCLHCAVVWLTSLWLAPCSPSPIDAADADDDAACSLHRCSRCCFCVAAVGASVLPRANVVWARGGAAAVRQRDTGGR
jgi:hypothetical protein